MDVDLPGTDPEGPELDHALARAIRLLIAEARDEAQPTANS